jgi:hypothetical protein
VITASTNRSKVPISVIVVAKTLARFGLLLTKETFEVVVLAIRRTTFSGETEKIDSGYGLLLLLLIESLFHRQRVVIVGS